jgi:hypothetical protein
VARIKQREIRQRGFFGWLFLILFWLFNIFMVALLLMYFSSVHLIANDPASQAGVVIGNTLAVGFIVFVWVAGAVILGLFAILTRGRKTIIIEEE